MIPVTVCFLYVHFDVYIDAVLKYYDVYIII